MTKKLLTQIERANTRYGLLKKGDRIVVALSGGPDSMALLSLLGMLSRKHDLSLFAAHLHHGLSSSNDRFLEAAKRAAHKAGIPIYTKKVRVRALAAKSRTSLEEAGRVARYSFLEEIARKTRSQKIATAHTLDDQAETVLLRLFRGAGLKGLAGIPIKRRQGRCWVIRPLLFCQKRDIMQFLKRTRAPYCLDPSNASRDFTRNIIRNQLIPAIEKGLGTPIQNLLSATAAISREAFDYLDLAARRVSPGLHSAAGSIRIVKLLGLHPALQREVVRLVIERKKGSLRGLTFSHIESILDIARSEKPDLHLRLPGLEVKKRTGKLLFVDTPPK